ncbi:pantoate-beta-alanine ligase [Sphaeroforma arctica JP610]|uniref:Pantoate--beta-alanine ligase n=1 Tax=Sphaeroforma arctica JP610 TaxID=667725 RepID=A0A0L0G0A3_9EUKA|nr:pantoate-beta-alanine ligase [Sphaeroforma arctica JP610]KNC81623.1 pantoate-beta-alanine ligase [Sphaeroforma arctica JP610]|eukprot:XP_014155525.1 pantoate-beta-alanine ligase [Sphaeroforma arctica JP610]
MSSSPSIAPLPTKLVSIKEMRANIAAFRRKNPDAAVGFVPTMGALHAGHLTIVTQAKIECDYVVASLFVNPAQFAANEDYDIYPRPIEEDMKLLGQEGVDAVFVPTTQEIYGDKNALEEGTAVEVRGLSHQLEGAIRPHFFRGVATVVSKLLNIVQPDFIYLGQKDAQQAVVVRNMIKDMHIPSELRVIQTVREKDGLAMSSRNAYLNEAQRAIAPLLYQAMGEALRLYVHEKERSTKVLLDAVKDYIRENGNELTELQYISINDTESLYEVETIGKQGALLSGALLLGEIRIIDNIILR